MPKIAAKEPIYAENQFIRHVESRAAWFGFSNADVLGPKVDITGATVRQYRKNPGKMQLRTLQAYIKLLKLDPQIVLRYLGYSQREINKALQGELAEGE